MFRLHEPSTAREDCGYVAYLVDSTTEKLVGKVTDPEAPRPEKSGAEWLGFWYRNLKGRDQRALGNATTRRDRKGRESQLYGDIMRETCLRAVVSIENVENPDGTPAEKITGPVYDLLPSAVTDDLYLTIKGRESEEELLGE
jgi:hypothetical protein